MKIIPFDPAKPVDSPKGRREARTLSFEAELAKANLPSEPGVRAIFSENLKASQKVSSEDLGTAGDLLKSLLGQIREAAPKELRKIHDLDGILYYYRA
jgi:hypothetical protein